MEALIKASPRISQTALKGPGGQGANLHRGREEQTPVTQLLPYRGMTKGGEACRGSRCQKHLKHGPHPLFSGVVLFRGAMEHSQSSKAGLVGKYPSSKYRTARCG